MLIGGRLQCMKGRQEFIRTVAEPAVVQILQEDCSGVVYCNGLVSEHSGLQGFGAVSSNGDSCLLE